MPLEEFLFPKEAIKYTGTEKVEFEGSTYDFFITNFRMILHARSGLPLLKKERIVSEKLPEIVNMNYKEKGLAVKKAFLRIETEKKKLELSGNRNNIKAIMKELQRYIKIPEEETPMMKETKETVVMKEVVMIPCPYCGALMPQTSLFCPNCGAKRRS